MVCLCCSAPTRGRLCEDCGGSFRPASDRILPGGVRLIAPFEHVGAARNLMHLLKYRGVTDFAGLAAQLLESRVPRLPLVPVPRALSRKMKYGVDPSRIIAIELAKRIQVPVLDVLAPPLHSARRAGRDHSRRVPSFRLRRPVSTEVLVLDDVVTTGGTVLSAARSVGLERVRAVVAANVVSDASNLARSD